MRPPVRSLSPLPWPYRNGIVTQGDQPWRGPGRHDVERRGEVPASQRSTCSGCLGGPPSPRQRRSFSPPQKPVYGPRRRESAGTAASGGGGRAAPRSARPTRSDDSTPPKLLDDCDRNRCLQSVMSAAGTAASSDPPYQPSRFLAANSRMGRRRPSVVDRWSRIAALRHHQVLVDPSSRSNSRGVVARVHSGMRRVPALTRVNPSAERGASAGPARSGAGRLWTRSKHDRSPAPSGGPAGPRLTTPVTSPCQTGGVARSPLVPRGRPSTGPGLRPAVAPAA